MPLWRRLTCLPAGRRVTDVLYLCVTFVLLCDNGTYYKGFTNNLERRYQQHLNGNGAKYTAKHKPIKIAYYETFETQQEAVAREKYFKSGSGREWLKTKTEGVE